MNKYLLTVELHEDKKAKGITIHGNPEGLETFANALLKLIKNVKEGHFNHDHFMGEQWGGTELTSELQSEKSKLINHAKIYCWKDSEFQS